VETGEHRAARTRNGPPAQIVRRGRRQGGEADHRGIGQHLIGDAFNAAGNLVSVVQGGLGSPSGLAHHVGPARPHVEHDWAVSTDTAARTASRSTVSRSTVSHIIGAAGKVSGGPGGVFSRRCGYLSPVLTGLAAPG